jgi:hypothetical protein
LLARIVDFQDVLLRLDFPQASEGMPPTSVLVESLGSKTRWRAVRRGAAPTLEVGLQKSSWHYEILPDSTGASPRWQPGLYVRGLVEDSAQTPQSAIALPASSLLVHQGRNLVYLERRLGRYERREVFVLGREDDVIYVAAEGWLASEDRVVSRQAQVLLSEEFRSEMDED